MSRTKGRAHKAINRLTKAAALLAEARELRPDLVDAQSWNASRIRLLVAYPHMPGNPMREVLDLAFARRSQGMGYLGGLEDPKNIDLLVTTYIRHTLTDYRSLEASFRENNKRHISKRLAIAVVSDTVEQIADDWRNGSGSNANAISGKGILEHDREEKASSTTPRISCCALLSSSKSAALPLQLGRPDIRSIEIRLPTLEEVQNAARSKKPQLSSWHSKAIKKTHKPRSKVSKRKAPIYSSRNAINLELAFARMDLTSIGQSNAVDVDTDRTQIEAPPETQMANLVAETSALGLHDTIIVHDDDSQLSRLHFIQESSSDATISDPDANYQEPSKRIVASSENPQTRNQRRRQYRNMEAIRAAEMSLQALTQKPRPDANRIAKASTRLEHARACLAKRLLRKQRNQEKAALKASMKAIHQARAPEANADYQYIMDSGRIDRNC